MSKFPLDLNALYYFAQVVERKGFTAAGAALGVPKSRLSRYVAELEAQLGVRLLQRTSRRLALTEIGAELYQHCVAMMVQAEAVQQAAQRTLAEPNGTVRCSVPVAIADVVLAKVLPEFMKRYPKVGVLVQASNRRIDLLEEGIDVVVRGAGREPETEGLIQSTLCTARWALLASPHYLAQHGDPADIDGLSQADCLLYQPLADGATWQLYGADDELREVPVRSRLRSDNLHVLREAALAGLGIAGLPLYACAQELQTGALRIVLPGWRPRAGRLSILFPSRRGMVPAVRVFIDFLKEALPPLL
ncbi:LysR substrate-binding domain-containing protein [Paraherbaspirillum soli]|uniref:LysR substrate-binding domain-containing protein n=1 Tax=Paraherbaspirillum soli TaxID=631222 RepID=A0ABW0MEX2_9BURK